jgi:hypothetical protein
MEATPGTKQHSYAGLGIYVHFTLRIPGTARILLFLARPLLAKCTSDLSVLLYFGFYVFLLQFLVYFT